MRGLDKVCSRDYLHKQRLVAVHIAAGSSSSSMDPFTQFIEESAWSSESRAKRLWWKEARGKRHGAWRQLRMSRIQHQRHNT